MVLVSGMDVWVESGGETFPLSSQKYAPGIVAPTGTLKIAAFSAEPWPRTQHLLDDGSIIEREVFMARGDAVVVVSWRLVQRGPGGVGEGAAGRGPLTLRVRPFLSGRDYHALHHANTAFRFDADVRGERVRWKPYPGVPAVTARSSGAYEHAPDWYYNFMYDRERERGLDFTEDLAAPGIFTFDLSRGEALLCFGAEGQGERTLAEDGPVSALVSRLRAKELARRGTFASRLERAADDYIVARDDGLTVIAGYPWFTDWGRDTFISLRGLCLATGRLDEAGPILLRWSREVSEGMLPNRFTDYGERPEYNAVDASLWFVIAAWEYLEACRKARRRVPREDEEALRSATLQIVTRFAAGARYGIRATPDGLLAAGVPGVQLTWMDAKCGDWVVTPRIGKPVEVQALWINALKIASDLEPAWGEAFARALASFRERFWNAGGGPGGEGACLYDIVDADHTPGAVDPAVRPNMLFAIGGLPLMLLDGERARAVVDVAERHLLTPVGLRSLSPRDPEYRPRYTGGPMERDGAYHQGTVWTWLMGPFVEAWVRVRGNTAAAKREARERFLDPLLKHLDVYGIGHLPEVADADPPHTPGGCPFQAWSVAEALRLDRIVLAATPSRRRPASARG